MFMREYVCTSRWWSRGKPIDQPVMGTAYSSHSSCPLGVKDTGVTVLITEAGSQRYKYSQQQLGRTRPGSTSPPAATLHFPAHQGGLYYKCLG